MYFRHGDVHLIKIDSLPIGGTEEKTTEVMTGELTGHAHRLMFKHGEGGSGVTARIIKGKDGIRRLEVTSPTELAHEEHHTRVIPAGFYEIRPTRETDHMAGVIRQVAD